MNTFTYLLWFYWNPSREILRIPLIDRPIVWYGVLFMLGFVVGYWVVAPMLMTTLKDFGSPSDQIRNNCKRLTDKLTWFLIIGTIVGARLGHVFFYEWPRYKNHPWDIFKTWEGGLACHGAILGILIAIFIFRRSIAKDYPFLTYLRLVDILCVPSVLGGFFIRVGNFINQEILGTITTMPWAVVFGDPADGSVPAPRHPVQLYEGIVDLIAFIALFFLWRRPEVRSKPGLLTGICFIFVFGARAILEIFKEPQSLMRDESWISTGQILSIPLVLAGLIFCIYALYKRCTAKSNQGVSP